MNVKGRVYRQGYMVLVLGKEYKFENICLNDLVFDKRILKKKETI